MSHVNKNLRSLNLVGLITDNEAFGFGFEYADLELIDVQWAI
jgi:hypothetical protein